MIIQFNFYGEPLPAGWDTQGLYQNQLNWETFNITDCVLCDSLINKEENKKKNKKDNNKKNNIKLLISGDVYGSLRVFNYPAIKSTSNQEYNGHSQIIAGIGKLQNKEEVITCGGMDMSIFQWNIKYGEPKKENNKIKSKKDNKEKDDIKEDIQQKKDKLSSALANRPSPRGVMDKNVAQLGYDKDVAPSLQATILHLGREMIKNTISRALKQRPSAIESGINTNAAPAIQGAMHDLEMAKELNKKNDQPTSTTQQPYQESAKPSPETTTEPEAPKSSPETTQTPPETST